MVRSLTGAPPFGYLGQGGAVSTRSNVRGSPSSTFRSSGWIGIRRMRRDLVVPFDPPRWTTIKPLGPWSNSTSDQRSSRSSPTRMPVKARIAITAFMN